MRGIVVLALACVAAAGRPARAAEGEQLLREKCAGCHEAGDGKTLSRIDDGRRTPEGWDMTVVRMTLLHGVQTTPAERAALVKHLADTRGLAPEEARPHRAVLERRPALLETADDEDVGTLCGKCHSLARTALQRRTADDWRRLVHFHLAQWPTLEYLGGIRDKDWWAIASTRLPDRLGQLYPRDAEAWQRWRGHAAPDLAGTWRVAGHRPGAGDYAGTMKVTAKGGDRYDVALDLATPDGTRTQSRGEAVVYTGYEWRAELAGDAGTVRQVMALDDDGNGLTGRGFPVDNDALGTDLRAVRVRDGGHAILAVVPRYVRAGRDATVAIHGTGLAGAPDFGPGVAVVRTVAASPDTVRVVVRAGADAPDGPRDVAVGETRAPGAFTVFRRVDAVRVEPAFAIARVGGNGKTPALPAQLEAVGYLNGADGKPGTADDVRIGPMRAQWSVTNFNAAAAEARDAAFAGRIDANGLFHPSGAGPNPQRKFRTNNAGDLAVHAVVDDAGRKLAADGHLIVTVQRWNDPPIL
ncbi:MAG TPA: quinohemoprotein amine dehydrogenase subunit alpha [Candidatus Binatia bacterium]|nr:quinohemoprotein amine dehydrogenase subunit alpha [Candidatus Binatia bacterium]